MEGVGQKVEVEICRRLPCNCTPPKSKIDTKNDGL